MSVMWAVIQVEYATVKDFVGASGSLTGALILRKIAAAEFSVLMKHLIAQTIENLAIGTALSGIAPGAIRMTMAVGGVAFMAIGIIIEMES